MNLKLGGVFVGYEGDIGRNSALFEHPTLRPGISFNFELLENGIGIFSMGILLTNAFTYSSLFFLLFPLNFVSALIELM